MPSIQVHEMNPCRDGRLSIGGEAEASLGLVCVGVDVLKRQIWGADHCSIDPSLTQRLLSERDKPEGGSAKHQSMQMSLAPLVSHRHSLVLDTWRVEYADEYQSS